MITTTFHTVLSASPRFYATCDDPGCGWESLTSRYPGCVHSDSGRHLEQDHGQIIEPITPRQEAHHGLADTHPR